MVTGWLPEHTGAARLAARQSGATHQVGAVAVTAVVVVAILALGLAIALARAARAAAASGRQARSPPVAASTLTGPTLAGSAGLAAATGVLERGGRADRPRGRRRRRGPRAASPGPWPSSPRASSSTTRTAGSPTATGGRRLPHRPPRRGAGGGGHRRPGHRGHRDAGSAPGRGRTGRPPAPSTCSARPAGPSCCARCAWRTTTTGARRPRGDRRRHRAAPPRGRAPRLRGQHQPRAEDARRGARPAGRDAPRRGRPGRVPAAWPSGWSARPSGSAAPSTTCSSSAGSRPSEVRLRDAVPVHLVIAEAVERVRPAAEQQGIAIEVDRAAAAAVGARRPPPARVGHLQPARQRREVLRPRLGREVRARTDGRWIDLVGRRPRDRHPAPRPRADLRALLPGRSGPQPRDRRHRARPGHRPPRRQPTTPARCGSSPTKARAPRSPCGCPVGSGPVRRHLDEARLDRHDVAQCHRSWSSRTRTPSSRP